jgi:hypothetical protein
MILPRSAQQDRVRGADQHVTPSAIASLSGNMRKRYYEEGGIFLTKAPKQEPPVNWLPVARN